MWEDLKIAQYSFTCRAKEKIRLPPYKGSALRGGLIKESDYSLNVIPYVFPEEGIEYLAKLGL